MGYSKKGEKESARKMIKQAESKLKAFDKSLFNMNKVYHTLLGDTSITKDNLSDKLAEITTYKFKDYELEMLQEELCPR